MIIHERKIGYSKNYAEFFEALVKAKEQRRKIMPKYMIQASYVGDGLKGLLKEGGTKRRETVAKVIEGMGGKLESLYYAFGDYDVVGIAEMPDNISSAAFSLTVNASGVIKAKTTVLLTPEEIDEVTKKTVGFRPPGQQQPVS